MYEIQKGSIFESKCELLVIPSANDGGVTSMIYSNIKTYNLPYLSQRIPLASVLFEKIKGNFDNACIIGYAATVDATVQPNVSSVQIIEQIMLRILQYAEENDIKTINIPLLGIGAGQLSFRDSFSTIIKHFKENAKIVLNIYAYTDKAYNDLLMFEMPLKQKKNKNPRVFISYTGVDSENEKWVRLLVDNLRKNGIDARIDIYHLKAGFDLPQWMANEVISADKVLLICDKQYVEKSDYRKGGVGWETMIIQGDMLLRNGDKYIAIVREEDFDKGLPIYMKSKYAIHWCEHELNEKKFKELVMQIFDCNIEPLLGEIPRYVIDALD